MNIQPILISKPEAARFLGIGQSTYDSQRKDGLLPTGIAISPRRVVYPTSEILAVAEARISGKTDDEVRSLVAAMEAKRPYAARALDPNANPRLVAGRARFFDDVRAGRRPAPRTKRATAHVEAASK